MVIQRNPKAGSRTRRTELLDLIRDLKAFGYRPRLFRHRHRLAEWMSVPRHHEQLCCIVAAGGDGTVGDLITRFPNMPIAVLPLGTENLLAKHFGLPRSGRALARIIHSGHQRVLDVGQMGGRRFVICAGVGIDAAIIHDVHRVRRGHITKAHYVGPIVKWFTRRDWPELTIRDATGQTYTATHVLIFNLAAYALGLMWAKNVAGDDGQLELRLFSRRSAWNLITLFWSAWHGTVDQRRDVICVSTPSVTITSEQPVEVHLDGDPAGTTPVEISVIPRALTLFIP